MGVGLMVFGIWALAYAVPCYLGDGDDWGCLAAEGILVLGILALGLAIPFLVAGVYLLRRSFREE